MRKSSPQSDLAPRICAVCGASYQPYRAFVKACSRDCYRKLPEVRAREAAHKALPHIRERKNLARHVDVNPVHRREINLRITLHRYGITPDEYRAKLAGQDGKCAICGKQATGGIKSTARLHVDHDHITGANRGLLCSRCNPGLGYFNNDPVLLEAAIHYLRRFQ